MKMMQVLVFLIMIPSIMLSFYTSHLVYAVSKNQPVVWQEQLDIFVLKVKTLESNMTPSNYRDFIDNLIMKISDLQIKYASNTTIVSMIDYLIFEIEGIQKNIPWKIDTLANITKYGSCDYKGGDKEYYYQVIGFQECVSALFRCNEWNMIWWVQFSPEPPLPSAGVKLYTTLWECNQNIINVSEPIKPIISPKPEVSEFKILNSQPYPQLTQNGLAPNLILTQDKDGYAIGSYAFVATSEYPISNGYWNLTFNEANFGNRAQLHTAISKQPGDLNSADMIWKNCTSNEGAVLFSTKQDTKWCKLTPGTTYYINMKSTYPTSPYTIGFILGID